MNKLQLKQFHYSAPYDYLAAMKLAREYMLGNELAKDKYKAYEYFKLSKKLAKINPKPASKEETNTYNAQAEDVEGSLKKSLYLDQASEKTAKTILRQATSTTITRESYRWFSVIRTGILDMAAFFKSLNLKFLGKVFGRVPILSNILLSSEIAFEIGIVTKTTLKQAWKDHKSEEGLRLSKIINTSSRSLTKDGRHVRLLSAAVWLGIFTTSLLVVSLATPLVVVGSLFDLTIQAYTTIGQLLGLNKEQKFLKGQINACNNKINEYLNQNQGNAGDKETSKAEFDWQKTMKSRLELRVGQLNAAKNYQLTQFISKATITGLLGMGAIVTLLPFPGAQIVGLGIIAAAGVGLIAQKLISSCAKYNVRTLSAIDPKETVSAQTNEIESENIIENVNTEELASGNEVNVSLDDEFKRSNNEELANDNRVTADASRELEQSNRDFSQDTVENKANNVSDPVKVSDFSFFNRARAQVSCINNKKNSSKDESTKPNQP